MGKKRSYDYVFTDLPEAWSSDKISAVLRSAKIPFGAVYKNIPHATWASVTLYKSEAANAARNALEQAAAEAAEPANAGAEDVQAGSDGAGASSGKVQGPARKKRRVKHRSSSWLRTPKIPADQVVIADVVCPLRNMPYPDQLLLKQQKVVEALQMIRQKTFETWQGRADMPEWIQNSDSATLSPLCCPLLGIVRSPQLNGYRNKCEFSIGPAPDGQPCVGFLIGAFKDGYVEIGEPIDCKHLPDSAVQVAKWVQQYLRTHSKLPVWDKRSNAGFWRLLIVREGRTPTWLPRPGQSASDEHTFATLRWQDWWVDTSLAPPAPALAPSPTPKHTGKPGNNAAQTAAPVGVSTVQESSDTPDSALAGSAPDELGADAANGAGGVRSAGPASAASAMEGGNMVQAGGTIPWAALGKLEEAAAPLCSEMLVLLQVNPDASTQEQMAAECKALGEHLLREAASCSPPLPLNSLVLQLHSGVSNVAQPGAPLLDLLTQQRISDGVLDATGAASTGQEAGVENAAADRGSNGNTDIAQAERGSKGAADGAALATAYIHDSLCNLQFRVSSGAFFQVNNGAAAVLYALAGDWISADGRALLLDVCCGTGTIGLSLAHKVREVVGIELIEQAVEDAKINAQDNGITNCTWVCGKAEDVLPQLLPQLPTGVGQAPSPDSNLKTLFTDHSELVAIVDPPRAGLHPKVLKALLRCSRLKRLVYVSCNPESMAANCVELCAAPSGRDTWQPFSPVKAMAVDLFPHTKHCEAVLLLER